MDENRRPDPYGVLVLHGLTSSLASVEPVAERLMRHGIPCAVPWLRGHGTRPEDLLGVTWRDWYDDAAAALADLQQSCDTVAVVGLSMGALVALHLALDHPARLRAVVAVAPALRQGHPLAPLVPLVAPFRHYLTVPSRGYSDAVRARLTEGYPRLPTRTFLSLVAYARWLEPRLAGVQTPVLILHSTADRVIRPDSARRIYERLGSADKTLRWFARSGHEMLVDCEADAVLAEIEQFILAHRPTVPAARAAAGQPAATPTPAALSIKGPAPRARADR